MLSDEDRVTAHRRLFAVTGGLRGREALYNELPRVREHDLAPSGTEVVRIPATKLETSPELRPRQSCEDIFQLPHRAPAPDVQGT